MQAPKTEYRQTNRRFHINRSNSYIDQKFLLFICSCCIEAVKKRKIFLLKLFTRVGNLNLMGENDVEGRGKTALSWRMMITTGYLINKKIEIKTIANLVNNFFLKKQPSISSIIFLKTTGYLIKILPFAKFLSSILYFLPSLQFTLRQSTLYK